MGFYCTEDKLQFEKSYIEILKLFGKENKKVIKAFCNRLKVVDTYSYGYADNDINHITPGKTGYEDSNPNKRIYIKLRGFNQNPVSKVQTQHYFSHEITHAFSVAAQDVFSSRQRIGVGNYNIPYFNNTRIGTSEYLGVSGSIYKKMEGNEQQNVIYGGGFCETMTDLFAVLSKVASSLEMRHQGITVDTVLKRPCNEWNNQGITTGYFASIPLARLAIAAFSNEPNSQYQNRLDAGESIFSTTKTDMGKEVKINDFIYGSMCDPLYIAEEYDKIVGTPGSYFKLCQPVDKIVDCYANRRQPSKGDIQNVIQQLSAFAKLNTMIKVQEGVYSQEYANKIQEEFEKIKSDVEREYGISNNIQITDNKHITPSEISALSRSEMNKNPGFFSKAYGKVKRFLDRTLHKNKDDKVR